MTKITISVRTHFKIEDIENLMYSMATGSSYWSDNVRDLGYESAVKQITREGKTWGIYDTEDENQLMDLNLAAIKKGLTLMAKKEPSHFADILNDDADQVTSDVLLQLALFGEVKYS